MLKTTYTYDDLTDDVRAKYEAADAAIEKMRSGLRDLEMVLEYHDARVAAPALLAARTSLDVADSVRLRMAADILQVLRIRAEVEDT